MLLATAVLALPIEMLEAGATAPLPPSTALPMFHKPGKLPPLSPLGVRHFDTMGLPAGIEATAKDSLAQMLRSPTGDFDPMADPFGGAADPMGFGPADAQKAISSMLATPFGTHNSPVDAMGATDPLLHGVGAADAQNAFASMFPAPERHSHPGLPKTPRLMNPAAGLGGGLGGLSSLGFPQAPDGFGLGLGLPPETAGLGGLGGGLGGLGGGASDLEWPGLPSWLSPPAAAASASPTAQAWANLTAATFKVQSCASAALHDRVAECAAARAALANAEAGAGALDEHQRRALRWQAGSVATAVGRAERKLVVTDDGAAFVAHGIYRGASAAQLHVQAVGRRLTVKIDAVANVTEASSAEVRLPDEAAEHEPMRAELEADGLLRVTVAKAKAVDVEVRQL